MYAPLRPAGHCVLASIHQPRTAVWNMFNKAALLSQGRCVFYGSRRALVPWLSDTLGYPYEPARHGVVADWAVDLVNVGFSKPRVGILT